MNVYEHKHRSPYKQSVFFLAFYLSIFILFIASAFMKRGHGSEIDRICIVVISVVVLQIYWMSLNRS